MEKQFFIAPSLFSPVKSRPSPLVAGSKDRENSGVSLELSLRLRVSLSADPNMKVLKPHDRSSIINIIKKRKMIDPCCSLGLGPKPKEKRINSQICLYTNEEEEKMTRLRLGDEDLWKIKKRLTKSDVDGSCRLLLPKESMNKHVIPLLDNDQAKDCGTVDGIRVTVFDFDTKTKHELTLKRWKTNSYLLSCNWNKEFKSRRNLEMGDEVGLFWNGYRSQLYFSLLGKAANNI